MGLVFTNDLCVGCNKCIRACSCMGACKTVEEEGNPRIEVDPLRCIACGACIDACEHHAREFSDDTERFFELVNESGTSSAELLQNLYSCGRPQEQQIPLAIMMSKRFLNGTGAVRVHGGGFAGTIQAFVPNYLTGDYAKEMERIFGSGSCYVLSVRPVGGYEFKEK